MMTCRLVPTSRSTPLPKEPQARTTVPCRTFFTKLKLSSLKKREDSSKEASSPLPFPFSSSSKRSRPLPRESRKVVAGNLSPLFSCIVLSFIYLTIISLFLPPQMQPSRGGGKIMASTLLLIALFFLLQSPAANATLDPTDFLALQSIRKSLSDLPGSDFFSHWDFTGDPCSFPGIFCSGNHVVSLALGDPRAGNPGLTGRLDPAIGSLSALSELTLVPGRVFGRIPDSISLCSSLRFLALSGNYLSGRIPSSLGSLPRLRTIDLSFNILSGEIPPSISALPALSNLVLCHNHLSGKIPPFPFDSPLLRLDVKHNNLSGEIPPLPLSLRYLAASSNRLCGTIDGILPRLAGLSYVDLSMNRLSGPIPGTLFSLPLSSLRLQRNQFSGEVGPLAEVRIPEVDLSYNRLSGSVSPLLAAVGRLYLNNNRFTGDLPSRFAERLEAAGMEVLYLQHNFLSGMELSPAAEIPVTTSLCLQYNCMVPPVEAPCPLKAGTQKTRPADQCPEWRG